MKEPLSREVDRFSPGAVLDSLTAQVCVLDRGGLIQRVNRAWAARAADAKHRPAPEPGTHYLRALEQALLAGDAYAGLELEGVRAVLEGRRREFTMESTSCDDPSTERWHHLTVTPLLAGGEVAGAVLSRREVTERRLAEKKLTTLYKAMDLGIDGLALMDAEGTFLYLNPAYAHLHGFEAPVDLAGRNWRELYPADQFGKIQAEVVPTLLRRGYWMGELVGAGPGGRPFHQEASLALVEQGRVLVCSVRDISERRRAEEALRASEARFRTMFESVLEGILALDPEGPRVAAANRTLLEMFGYAPDQDLSELEIYSHIVEEDRQRVAEDLVRVLREGFNRPMVYGALTREGRRLWIRCLGTPTHHGDRPVVLVAVSDITLERAAEEALREREEIMRLLVEGAKDFFYYVHDRDYRFTYISPSFEEITGYSPEHMMGSHAPINTEPGPVPSIMESSRRAMEEGVVPPPYLYEVKHRDGRTLLLEIHERPLVREGEVVGMQGIGHNVTDRVRMEQELRESEERFRHIVEHAPDFIFYIQDGEGRFLYISPTVEALTGRPAEFYMQPHAPTSTDNPRNEESEMVNRRVFQEGITPPSCRYEIFHADGRRIVLEAFERPVLRDGKVVQVIGLCRDVSNRPSREADGVGPVPYFAGDLRAPVGAGGGDP